MYKATADIGKTTEGLITAFASTLWGLTGTILVAIGALFLDHKQDDFLNQLDDTTAVILLPLLNPPQLSQTLEESSRDLAESAHAIRNTIQSLETSAGKTFESIQKLDDIVKNFDATAVSFHGSADMINTSQIKINETLVELGAKVSTADNREQSLFANLDQVLLRAAEQQKLLKDMFVRLQETETLTEKVLRDCLIEISTAQQRFLDEMRQSESKQSEVLKVIITKQHALFESFIENVTTQNLEIIEEIRVLNQEQGEVLGQIKSSSIVQSSEINELFDNQQKILEKIQKISIQQSRGSPRTIQPAGGSPKVRIRRAAPEPSDNPSLLTRFKVSLRSLLRSSGK
jgi:hypothetical protein